jgi:hypothetical protein
MEVSGQILTHVGLPPGEKSPRYPFDRTMGGPQDRSGLWRIEKSCFAGKGIWAVQVARHYIDSRLPSDTVL